MQNNDELSPTSRPGSSIVHMAEQDLELALKVFIQYGYKKSSMENVADALNLSRQALYKRYGNKEQLFKAVVHGNMARTFKAANEALNLPGSLAKRFIQSIDLLAGSFVDQLRASPHGLEVIAFINVEFQTLREEFEIPYFEARVRLLLDEGITSDPLHASNIIFAMTCSAKGLLLMSPDRPAFLNGLTRVMSAFLPETLLPPSGE